MIPSWVKCLLVCVSLALLPSVCGKIALEDWHCGSEEVSRQMAYDEVMGNCPDFAGEMNHCCVIHDECYVRQSGQDVCDEDFCQCNKRALNRTGGKPCRSTADLVCFLMPFVGVVAYENSVNYTESPDLGKYLPTLEWPEVQESYENLYKSCNRLNSTVSSCAIQQNECELNKYANHSTCANNMCNCLRDVYRMDADYSEDGYNATCLAAVTHACREAVLAANILEEEDARVWYRRNILSPYRLSITVVAVAATCSVLLVLWCITQIWWKDREDTKKIKYTAVI